MMSVYARRASLFSLRRFLCSSSSPVVTGNTVHPPTPSPTPLNPIPTTPPAPAADSSLPPPSQATPTDQPVLIERRPNGVYIVTLNRPKRHNALDMDMFRAIQNTARMLRSDRSCRAVVLRGDGPSFCSGLDFTKVMKNPLNMVKLLKRPSDEMGNLAQDVAVLWRQVPVPVIAVTHGACFGGGFQIALGADMRIAAPEARFSVMEIKWGLIPDMGISVTLRELVPIDVAKELTMTGRVFGSEEAKALNIVTKIAHDPLAEALKLADQIAEKSPDAICAAKRMFNDTWAVMDEQEALITETKVQRRVLPGWNMFVAAVKGIFKKQLPYKKRLRRWGW